MIKNCINCGAIITSGKCDYCGTIYDKKFGVDFENDFKGKLTYKGQTFDVYMSDVNVTHIGDEAVRDFSGRLTRVQGYTKRTFTLIEY